MAVFSVLLLAGFLLLLAYYLQYRWLHRHILAAASRLPCPPALPIVGNALFFVGGITSITKNIIRFTTEFKGLFCIWVGPVPVFVVSDPSDAQIILNSSNTLEKDDIYKFLKPFLGNGLLTAPVPMWKKYRRLISPVLHPSNVEKFLPVFNDVSRQLVDGLSVGGNTPVDPRDGIFNAAMDAVLETVFVRKPTDPKTKKNIQFLFDMVGKMFIHRLFKVWLHVDWLFNLLYRKAVSQAKASMDACMDAINQELKDEVKLRSEGLESQLPYWPDRLSRKNLVDIIFTNPREESEDHDWTHEVATMVVGATDTVVAAVSFLLVTLANHPETQSKVYAEIQEVIGGDAALTRDVTLSELNSMTYLGQAIMEGMRLHGIFPVILRKATKDTKLSEATLPAGSRVLLTLHAMGWDEDQFPEPDRFLPERFSQETQRDGKEKRHNYAFLPFSGGPRNCLGKSYAMLIMKTMMVHVLRRFRLRTEVRLEDIEYELKVVMFSKTPLHMKFEPRVSSTVR